MHSLVCCFCICHLYRAVCDLQFVLTDGTDLLDCAESVHRPSDHAHAQDLLLGGQVGGTGIDFFFDRDL